MTETHKLSVWVTLDAHCPWNHAISLNSAITGVRLCYVWLAIVHSMNSPRSTMSGSATESLYGAFVKSAVTLIELTRRHAGVHRAWLNNNKATRIKNEWMQRTLASVPWAVRSHLPLFWHCFRYSCVPRPSYASCLWGKATLWRRSGGYRMLRRLWHKSEAANRQVPAYHGSPRALN